MTLLQDLPAKERMDSCYLTDICCISILRSFPQTAVKILHLSTEKFLISPPEQPVLFSAREKIPDKTHETQGENVHETVLITQRQFSLGDAYRQTYSAAMNYSFEGANTFITFTLYFFQLRFKYHIRLN